MAQRPSVRWNERNERWMAWVRFPDGSRRKVERTDKAEAQHDLDELLALRAQALDPGPRRQRSLTFSEVIDVWFEAGCPNVAPSRKSRHARVKAQATIENARQLLGSNVRPAIGPLWVDRTTTGRLEKVFTAMDADGKSTSTIDRSWNYRWPAGSRTTTPATARPQRSGSGAARRPPGSRVRCEPRTSLACSMGPIPGRGSPRTADPTGYRCRGGGLRARPVGRSPRPGHPAPEPHVLRPTTDQAARRGPGSSPPARDQARAVHGPRPAPA